MTSVITGRGLRFNIMPGVARLVVRDVPVGVRMANPFYLRRQGEKKIMPKDLRRNLYVLYAIKQMCGKDKAKEIRRVLSMWCAGEEFVCGEGVLHPLLKKLNLEVDFDSREIKRKGHVAIDDYYFTFLKSELSKISNICLDGMFVPKRSYASVKKLSCSDSDVEASKWLQKQYLSGAYFREPRLVYYGGKYNAAVFKGIRAEAVKVRNLSSTVRMTLVKSVRDEFDRNLRSELIGVLGGAKGWMSRRLEKVKQCKLTGIRKRNFDMIHVDRRYRSARELVDAYLRWFDEVGYSMFERLVEFSKRRPQFKIVVESVDPG